jgi:hypothetical protein
MIRLWLAPLTRRNLLASAPHQDPSAVSRSGFCSQHGVAEFLDR